MGKEHVSEEEATAAMEKVYAAAFDTAKSWRKDKGLPIGHRAAPRKYKMTLWLRPWEYIAMCSDASHAGVSVTKYLQDKLTDPRLKPFLPTRENKAIWKAENPEAQKKAKVSSLRTARLKRAAKLLDAKGETIGELLAPGTRRTHAFAKARRAVGFHR